MINELLFSNKQKKDKVEYSVQFCDCGKKHNIPKIEVGTCKFWVCPSCLDKQSKEFDVWFDNLRNKRR